MKKIFISFLLISFSLSTSYSQSGWFWQNPLPQGNNLRSVQYLQGGVAYACGGSGTVLKTTDDGLNWTILPFPSKSELQCVFFLNPNTGWIAVYSYIAEPHLYFTSNGGETWLPRDSPSYLYTIRFLNELTGFAGGDDTLYKTTDGGINWTQCYYAAGYYSSICFVDAQTAFVSAGAGYYYGKIIKTTNSGQTWATTAFGSPVDYVSFMNSQTGFAVSLGKILMSTNSGITWNVIYTGPQYSGLESVAFAGNANISVCGGTGDYYDGTIITSTNGGANWSFMTFGRILPLYSISFGNSSSGFSVGRNGVILKSTDAGVSWNRNSTGNLNSLYGISFVNSNTGCAVGDSGLILRTSNGGNDWIISGPINSSQFLAVKLTDASTGYAAGGEILNGIIYKSTNAGVNWFALSPGAATNVMTMSWLDNNTGYAGCANGTILKTVNGGSNWISFPSGLPKIFSFSFLDANTGYALSDTSGGLFKTSNGGLNWAQISSYVDCLCFLNSSTGFISDDDIIRKTTNGGTSWSSYNIIPAVEILTISFLDLNTGYAAGSNGLYCKTTNSGQTWIVRNAQTRNRIYSLAITSSSDAYICGENGMILKTTTGGEPISIRPISQEVPKNFSLSQNYPNPFNPATMIKFSIPPSKGARGMMNVRLIIYDILGREVAVLVNEQLTPGTYEIEWNGINYPSGVYFCRLETAGFTETKRMVLIK